MLLFVGLSVDVMVRLWAWRARFSSLFDVALIFYLESIRSIVITTGIIVAAIAGARAERHAAAWSLAFAVGFATLVYAKISVFDAFPGEVQERMALWLGARGVTPDTMMLLFGHAEWAAWLTLAAFIRFAVQYPRPITVADIEHSGQQDRLGAFRSVALAGTDVGAMARNAAAIALQRGWLSARVVWLSATLLALTHTTLMVVTAGALVVKVTALLAAFVPTAVLIALVRASMLAADTRERRLLSWLRRGALYGGALFIAGALITQLLPALPLGAITLSMAPVATVACWLWGVRALE